MAQDKVAPQEQATVNLADIVVTAQRRSESIMDVPLSIAAKTGEQLERSGVTSLLGVSQLVPGVKIDQFGNFLQPAIRGVSSTLAGPGTEAPVAVYVDGVMQPNQLANFLEFVDLDRIEVAKGPQGTLFGRNATGGAISLFTKTPSYAPKGKFTVSYGNYDDFKVQGFVSAPLIDNVLAVSLSGIYNRRDSYDYDIARDLRPRGLRTKVIRGKILFEPAEWAKITVIGQYQDRFNSDAGSGIALNSNTPAHTDPTAIIATRPRQLSLDTDSYLRVKEASGSITGNFTIGEIGTLNSITAYAKIKASIAYDSDRAFTGPTGYGAAVDFYAPDEYYSQELSFASEKFGPFSFVAGAYYYHDDNRYDPIHIDATKDIATRFSFNAAVVTEAVAGFAEANLDITDRLKVIGGIRYSWESKQDRGSISFGPTEPEGFGMLGQKITFDSWTPRLSVKYDIADRTNVYFTYSQGFKSGGTNLSFLTGQFFQPETIKAYEVGLKSAPSRDISFNVASYYYDYSNLQVQVQQTIGTNVIVNAAKARIYGVDADAMWRPIDGLSLSAGVSVLDAKYDDFPNATVQQPKAPVPGIGLVGNETVILPNAEGNWMTRSPKYSLSLVADYRKSFDPGTFGANLSFSRSGRVFYDSANRVSQKPYSILNGQLSFQPAGTEVRIELWGKNLTNTNYIGAALIADSDAIAYAPPRTYGVSAHYSF
ncbi:TonB-dependent receptor [Sphingobium tyrosinilyticum]|uniref:TonB-dependent receptor n=1 Tax=Sphingobium tyrosinilyticum TaxID=2715436 RepID=A0ABV9F647_9SPHN